MGVEEWNVGTPPWQKFGPNFLRSGHPQDLAALTFRRRHKQHTPSSRQTPAIVMPPRIPVRFAWALRRAANSTNASCSALCVRAFSSGSPLRALGPESPNYVEVPKPRQPTYPLKPDIKGHLPVPRDVFKTRSKLPKESETFIAQSTQDAKKAKVPGPYSRDAEYILHKQRLAESRKQALREGVKQLHKRKIKTEVKHLARIRKLGAQKRTLAMAPPRTVDVLTQTSISKSIRDFLHDKLPPASSGRNVRRRKLAYAKRIAKQDAVRRERLHDLYTNAREFIITEEQLDEAIEKAFGSEENPVRWDNRGNALTKDKAQGMSPWEGSIPEGVADKLQKLKGGEGVGLATERVRKVAEALTGGKM